MDNTDTPIQESSSMDTLKQYGKIGIITHLALSWTFLLATYLFIQRTGKSGLLIKKLKLESKIPEKAGSFAIAGIIYKAVMPARLAVSAMLIPLVIKAVGEDEPLPAVPEAPKPTDL
jgi:hypothetical protein